VDQAHKYAVWVLADAKQYHLDPWIFVAIVQRETRWVNGLVRYESNGSCSVGLGQINLSCDSPEIAPLRDARTNLQRMGQFLNHIRSSCKNNCRDLGWLRAYNPGSAEYFNSVREVVRVYDAQDGEPFVLRLPDGMHSSGLSRQGGGRAVHDRRVGVRHDPPIRLHTP
jgi:hypothetical protein